MELSLLFSRTEIDQEITRVAREVSRDYAEREFLMVGVLKGCLVFMGQLLPQIVGKPGIDFVTVSSYGEGVESGELRLIQDLRTSVEGKEVVIVEDIVDTGKTVSFLKQIFLERGARSVEVLTFVDKPARRECPDAQPRYRCFDYEGGHFLLGFGFDLAEAYRNLPEVYEMHYDAQD